MLPTATSQNYNKNVDLVCAYVGIDDIAYAIRLVLYSDIDEYVTHVVNENTHVYSFTQCSRRPSSSFRNLRLPS